MRLSLKQYEAFKAPKKPKISEKDITATIRTYLKFKKVFHWKVFQTLGATPGIPDIIGILPGGRALFIEVKTENGKLSEAQEAFLENAKALGALAFVARHLDDVIAQGI